MDEQRERRIRMRAFDLWQREGSLDGRTLGHWLQAEREIDDEDAEEARKRDAVALAGAANLH
ncbi:UNVERIFIED_ORG: DUF2934 domain-containing protein [Roseateles sp. XES5]|nr:DUF2934 domain-containing protein [Roseateles sp. XES5]